MLTVPRRGRIRVYEYRFELHVSHCKVQVKFPCTYFLCWRTGDKSSESDGSISPVADTIPFNTTLRMNVDVAFDEDRQVFLEKKTILCVNLNSNGRPSESRLVGVVSIDVSMCLNTNDVQELRTYSLERCMDKSNSVMFSLKGTFIKQLTPPDYSESLSNQTPVRDFNSTPTKDMSGVNGVRVPQARMSDLNLRSVQEFRTEERERKSSEEIREEKSRERSRSRGKRTNMTHYRRRRQPESDVAKGRHQKQQQRPTKIYSVGSEKQYSPGQRSNYDGKRSNNSLFIARIHQSSKDKKKKNADITLREEIMRLKNMCKFLNNQLARQHIQRVELEADLDQAVLQITRLEEIQRVLQRQLENLRHYEQDKTIRLLRKNIERLQHDLDERSLRITTLEEEVIQYMQVKLTLSTKIQTLANQLEQAKLTSHFEANKQTTPLFTRSDSLYTLQCFARSQQLVQTETQTHEQDLLILKPKALFVENEAQTIAQQSKKKISSSVQNQVQTDIIDRIDNFTVPEFNQYQNQHKLVELQKVLESNIKENKQIEQKLQQKLQQLDEVTAKLQAISTEFEVYKQVSAQKENEYLGKIAHLQNHVSYLKSSVESIYIDIKVKNQQMDDIKLIMCYLEQSQTKLKASLEEAEKKLTTQEIKNEIRTLTKKFSEKEHESDNIIRNLSSKIIQHKLSYGTFVDQIFKREEEIKQLRKQVERYEAELTQEKQRTFALSQSQTDLRLEKKQQSKNDSLEFSVDSMKQSRQLRRKLEESILNEQMYKMQIDQLISRNTLLQKYLKKFEQEVTNNRRTIQQSKKTIEDLSIKSQSQSKVQEFSFLQQRTSLENEIMKLIAEKQKLQDELENLQYENKNNERQIQSMFSENTQLKQELQQLKTRLEQCKSQSQKDRRICQLEDNLKYVQSKYQDLQKVASLRQSDNRALSEIVRRYDHLQPHENTDVYQLQVENRELQQVLVSLVMRNKDLMGMYKEMCTPRTASLRELSLEINKAKSKLLSNCAAEQIKGVMGHLRPLQDKIQQLIKENEQVQAAVALQEPEECKVQI